MSQILEQGRIFFFYRPKIEQEAAHGEPGVQRFYLVLEADQKGLFRQIVIGRKHVAHITRHEHDWAFVQLVTSKVEDLRKELNQFSYDTKTLGQRQQASARLVGEGIYAIVLRERDTFLVYMLSLPQQRGKVQKELRIEAEGSYALSIKNPKRSSPAKTGLSASQKAIYPFQLQEKFANRRFIPANPVELLDYPGTELIMVGAMEDVHQELGIHLADRRVAPIPPHAFEDLKLKEDELREKPIQQGQWS
jgi:hypothetical protein